MTDCAVCHEEIRQTNHIMCLCGKHYCNACMKNLYEKISHCEELRENDTLYKPMWGEIDMTKHSKECDASREAAREAGEVCKAWEKPRKAWKDAREKCPRCKEIRDEEK